MTQLAAKQPAVGRDPYRAFLDIDWAFEKSIATAPHQVHPYPARFIPDIPRAALTLIRGLDGPVLDPFCGAGTTIIEAIRDGRDATGIDLNPIATLITRVKSIRWRAEDERLLQSYVSQLSSAAEEGDGRLLAAARDRIPRLDHWFTADAQRALAGATAFIQTVHDEVWRDRLSLAISASVVRVSKQESDTRYAAIEKPVTPESIVDDLQRSVLRLAQQLREYAPYHSGHEATVITGDAADSLLRLDSGRFAAAVFSPPYPNAYEYWLYHKYRMYWLGFDPVAVRADEIGARPHYSGSGRSTIETFRLQMEPVLWGISRCLRPSGICLIVVGDSLIKGSLYNNGKLFRGLGRHAGLTLIASAERPLRSSRKSFNLAVARIKSEHVLLFQKR